MSYAFYWLVLYQFFLNQNNRDSSTYMEDKWKTYILTSSLNDLIYYLFDNKYYIIDIKFYLNAVNFYRASLIKIALIITNL